MNLHGYVRAKLGDYQECINRTDHFWVAEYHSYGERFAPCHWHIYDLFL